LAARVKRDGVVGMLGERRGEVSGEIEAVERISSTATATSQSDFMESKFTFESNQVSISMSKS
jgi:hypothetical protein